MDSISNGCRLCLDAFAESFATIDNPELKQQMEKVFSFSIEPKEGYCSSVCQSCLYAISEFYQYSEKVRHNQEFLDGNLTNCDQTIDSKITLESVKVGTLSDSNLPETIEHACKLKDEVSGEENVPTIDSKITIEYVKVEAPSDHVLPEPIEDACDRKDMVSGKEEAPNSCDEELYEPLPKKSQTKRRGHPGKRKIEPTKTSKKNFKTQEQRNEEDQQINKHYSMICDLCGTSTATFTKLVSHFRKDHERRYGYIVCCNKKLFKRYSILDHIDFHANPDAFRCEVCGSKYKNKDILHAHMLCKHPSAGSFQCDLCSQSFALKTALAKHMEQHVKLTCTECNKRFACKNSLSYHMINQHSGKDRTMVCDTCGKEFLSKDSFNRHRNEHLGIEIERLQCGICQRWLKGEKGLRNHMNWVHTDGNQEIQCDICQQKYPHPRALYLHKRHTHAEPKHECDLCGKKFKKAMTLKEHRTSHTGEVLYSCDYCGTPKNCMAKLYRHIKHQHPTEWAQKKLKATQNSGSS